MLFFKVYYSVKNIISFIMPKQNRVESSDNGLDKQIFVLRRIKLYKARVYFFSFFFGLDVTSSNRGLVWYC